eukprot:6472001-Amphidinium_carterae.3
MGHPHTAQFIRLLRCAGATDLVLEVAKKLRCSVCESVKPPKGPKNVCADSHSWFPSDGRNRFVLHQWARRSGVTTCDVCDMLGSPLPCSSFFEGQGRARTVRHAYRKFGVHEESRCESDGTLQEMILVASHGKTLGLNVTEEL